jgi:hypothetical protein
MRILRIKLSNYRGTTEREVAFAPGVTIVEGPNEIGKSSLAEALDLVFKYLDSSGAKAVKDTFPVQRDASPEIEVELVTGPYHLVYRKRFGKGASTELEITEPTPESLTGRPAHERVEQILEETLDADLWKALRVDQGVAIDQARLADSEVLGRALDAASGGTGLAGDDSALFERVETEYLSYFTPKGREKSLLTDSEGEVEEWSRSVSDLQTKHDELQAEVEESARLASRRRELTAEAPSLEANVRRCKEEWNTVAALETEVEKAGKESESAVLASQLKEKAWSGRQQQIRGLSEGHQGLAELEEQRAADESKKEVAQAALEEAKASLAAAQSTLRDTEGLRSLCANDLGFRRRELEAAELEERFERVTRYRGLERDAKHILETNLLTDAALEEVREQDFKLRQARTQLQEGGPQLRVHALTSISVEIDEKTVELSKGSTDDRSVTRPVTVRVPGQLEVTVRPGTSTEELENQLETAERKWESVCEAYGISSIGNAAAAHEARKRAERDVEDAAQRLKEDLREQTLEELDEKRSQRRSEVDEYPAERVAEPPLPETMEEAKERFQQANEREEEAKSVLETAAVALEGARQGHEKIGEAYARLQGQIESEGGQMRSLTGQLETARKAESDESLRVAAEATREKAEQARSRQEELRAQLKEKNPAQAKALLDGAGAALKAVEDESRELELRLTRITGSLKAQEEAGLFEELGRAGSRLEHARREQANLSRRAGAARRLFDTLRRHRDMARSAYVAPLATRIDSLGQIVFDPTFQVTLGDDLRIESRTLQGVTLPFDCLSAGTQEQLGLLARLAVAMTVSPDDGVPLILDDALGNSDLDRRARISATIAQAATDCQVIILTCSPDRFRGIPGAQIERLAD